LDNHPGGKIILSGIFDFNDRNVAIMHDNTEIHGDGSAVIRNGANSIAVGHIRHDIQYHFTDPDQWDNHKIVRNVTISNLRFENSLQTAVFVVAHDGESYIANNEFIGGRITAEDVGYHNHGLLAMVLIGNVDYTHDALKGIVNVDDNYIDGQWRLDPNGHRYWYYDRPDLKFNGINFGMVNGNTGATLNANNNVIENVGIGIFQLINETGTPQCSSFTNNKIDVVNGPYASTGIYIMYTPPTNYIIANNDISIDYKPELDFATYPEWGTDPDAEYLHAEFYEGIHMDTPHWMDNETIITKNTIEFTDNHPELYLVHAGMFFFWEESNMAITHNEFKGSALYGINFFGGNSNNVLHANNFEHFAPFTEGYSHPWGFYLEPGDIVFGMAYPADYNTVIGGGSSSGKLDIVDNGTGNLVGNNNVAHSDPQQMQAIHELLQERKQLMKEKWGIEE
jgi:hypothetical protein